MKDGTFNPLTAGHFTGALAALPDIAAILDGVGGSPYALGRKARIQMGNVAYLDSFEKGAAEYHAQTCTDPDCEWCDSLCDQGLIVACDGCGHTAHTDRLNFWTGIVDERGGCLIYCPSCAPADEPAASG